MDAGYKVRGSYNNFEKQIRIEVCGIFTNNKTAADFGVVEEGWDNEVEIGKEMESKQQRGLRRQWRDRWVKDADTTKAMIYDWST
jgi:hypothetical protein